jgi:hypothetical protein
VSVAAKRAHVIFYITWWLENERPYPAEQIAGMFQRMVVQGVPDALGIPSKEYMAISSDRFIPNISLRARGRRLVARPIQLTIGRAVLRLLLAISAD